MPPWYEAFDRWLLDHGWPALVFLSLVVIGVTLFLLWRRQAVPLALWLTYLAMP